MQYVSRTILCLAFLAVVGPAASGQAPAEAPDPAALPAEAPAESDEVRLTFNFRYQPWQEVLDWFADEAGLSLLLESAPPGTFNYRDSRTYTPAEALDVLNGVLLTKGYTLVRSGRMLVLVNLEDGIPPNLVPDVPLAELDERGEYELIRVLFPLWNMTPEQAAEEVQPLLGPQGKAITLPQARQIQVTETAGRLRTIRSIIHAVEPPGSGTAGVREFTLNHLKFDQAIPTIRLMLGIPPEATGTPDGSMQITKSATDEKLLFRGTAQHAARLQEILRLIDVPEGAEGVDGSPQLEVYTMTVGDPEAVEDALEDLLGDDPKVSVSADDDNGFLVVVATPSQHAMIRATLDQMQQESREVDVIALSSVDPQMAVLAINKLFGAVDDDRNETPPRVDADMASRSLLVRGTTAQIEQIRGLMRKLGETGEDGPAGRTASRQRVRLLPLSGAAARSAIAQIEEIWPSVRSNRIRVVAPSATIPIYRPSEPTEQAPADERPARAAADEAGAAAPDLWQMFLNGSRADAPVKPAEKPAASEDEETGQEDRVTAEPKRVGVFRFAAEQLEQIEPPGPNPSDIDAEAEQAVPKTAAAPQAPPGRGAPILIAPGPGGTVIASDDLEALDQLEELLSIMAGRNSTSGREYAVYYLKYSKASTIADVLAAIFGGGSGGNDRGIIGEMANDALGNVGGALMGDLLLGSGGGSGAFTSANIDIVPDARLNALIVHARPADLDTIEQLLKVLDQRTGPELVEAEAQPRLIAVYNTTATEVSEIVQQVYHDRMAGAGAMSPQEMMQMLRGGPNTESSIQKMSIAVDIPNNMLIVRAPDPLFEEVKQLVAELDQSLADSPEVTRVVSLKHTNSEAVQNALTSILDNVSANSTDRDRNTRRRGEDDDDPQERARRAMRGNWEMMQEMRRMQERMGGGGGDRRGGEGGRPDFRRRGGGEGDGDRGRRGRGRGND